MEFQPYSCPGPGNCALVCLVMNIFGIHRISNWICHK